MSAQGDSNSGKSRRTLRSSSSVVAKVSSGAPLGDNRLLRELPSNIDAEEGVLASMILDTTGEVITNCITLKVNEDYFYSTRNSRLFSAIVALYDANKPTEEIVLAEYLSNNNQLEEIGGIEAIARIVSRIETHANYKYWVEIVREKYFLRELIKTCTNTIEGAYVHQGDLPSFIEGVEEKIMRISQDRISDSVRKASEQVGEAVSLIDKMIRARGEYTGIPTGFYDLDSLMRGLHDKEMIVIAGRPSTGKTSIAVNMVESAIFGRKRVPSLIFSLEMGAAQLYMRMIASRAGVNQHLLREGKVQNKVMADINKVAQELMEAPLWIDDTADITILEMRAKARRLQQQLAGKGQKLGLIAVDYLQLLKGLDSRAPREQQVSEISRGMKAMAKEISCPVIVLAQLNRENEKLNRDPKASDLRESGSIEQDADVILLLSWKKKTASVEGDISDLSLREVKVEIAKQRNGPTGHVDLLFNRNLTRYENLSKKGNDVI